MEKKQGSLLIEVIFSIALLSTIALYVLPIFYQSMSQHQIHQEQEEIVMTAQNQMERILSCVYQGEEIYIPSDDKYSYEVVKDEKNNLCHVTLTVKERKNERSVKLEVFGEKGIYSD